MNSIEYDVSVLAQSRATRKFANEICDPCARLVYFVGVAHGIAAAMIQMSGRRATFDMFHELLDNIIEPELPK